MLPNVPAIVHQTAPQDRSRWHPRWTHCRKSWRKVCPGPDYEHRFWDDDDLRALVAEAFPEHLETYDGYEEHIQRVDFARAAMLYLHGGIYVDMDVEALKSPMRELAPGKISVVESPYRRNERHQNSMMASPPGHPFWKALVKEAANRFSCKNTKASTWWLTGPQLLDALVDAHPHDVHVLPANLFNPATGSTDFDAPLVYTRHFCTSVWTHTMNRQGMMLNDAVRAGDIDLASEALVEGADMNCRDRAGLTPLHHAALKGDAQMARFLLKRNSDPDAKDLNNATACHYAVQMQAETIVKVLLAAFADPNAPLKDGDAAGLGPASLARLMMRETPFGPQAAVARRVMALFDTLHVLEVPSRQSKEKRPHAACQDRSHGGSQFSFCCTKTAQQRAAWCQRVH